MLRAIALVFQNEFRLLAKDRVGLFMLVLAPIVIIAVAGFSLGGIYGAHTDVQAYFIPVVDHDHDAVAQAVIDELRREPTVRVAVMGKLPQARTLITTRDRAPLAILIPAGTTATLKAGHQARLTLYVDPLKRLEVDAIELRLSNLCQRITAAAQDHARHELAAQGAELRGRLARLNEQMAALQSGITAYQRELVRGRTEAQLALAAQMRQAMNQLEQQTRAAVDRSLSDARAASEQALAPRGEALRAVQRYLVALQASERDFDRWLVALKAAAGSHAADIPPPPRWPSPPSSAQLAELSKPLQLPVLSLEIPRPVLPTKFAFKFPDPPSLPTPALMAEVKSLPTASAPTIPGSLTWRERSSSGGNARVNAFDQYVPGFGITFLLIGMLMGISLGLIDDRDWGTLERLRVSGAPLTGTLIGKLLSRFLVGLLQLVLLFAIGWWLFGISLGRQPAMLLLPAAAIAFAAAAFGLIIACVARTHDSVMPVGAVVAMAMSAIGGCWWPIDFEPSWMREVALWMPTTWTMQAFNDLMIRDLSPVSALWPCAVTVGLGVIFLVAGIAGASRVYE